MFADVITCVETIILIPLLAAITASHYIALYVYEKISVNAFAILGGLLGAVPVYISESMG